MNDEILEFNGIEGARTLEVVLENKIHRSSTHDDDKRKFNVRTSNLLVYHYDGQGITRLTARVLSSLSLSSRVPWRTGEERRDVTTSTPNPPTIVKKVAVCVVHNWRAHTHTHRLFIRLARMPYFDVINHRSSLYNFDQQQQLEETR